MAIKWLKARWKDSNAGGGVSIQGFKEIREQFIERPDGGQEYVRDKVPTMVTIQVRRADDKDPIEKGDQVFRLRKGEFIVQEIEDNVKTLKNWVKKGVIQMSDWDLQEEYSETELPAQVSEKIIEEETETFDITLKDSKAAKEKKKQETLERLRNKNKSE